MYILQYCGYMDDFVVGIFKRKKYAVAKAKKSNKEELRKSLNKKYCADCSTFICFKIITLNKRGQISGTEVVNILKDAKKH